MLLLLISVALITFHHMHRLASISVDAGVGEVLKVEPSIEFQSYEQSILTVAV